MSEDELSKALDKLERVRSFAERMESLPGKSVIMNVDPVYVARELKKILDKDDTKHNLFKKEHFD